MDERSAGFSREISGQGTRVKRAFGSVPGSRERYHKLFDEVFTCKVCLLSHMRSKLRVCARRESNRVLLTRFWMQKGTVAAPAPSSISLQAARVHAVHR